MRIITRDESLQAAAERGISSGVNGLSLDSYNFHAAFVLPADTGKKTALATSLVEAVQKSPDGLFWITSFGVWKSSENLDLFLGYRKSLGETRSLSEAPGHVFGQSDATPLTSLVSLSLYFFWDAVLVDGSGGAAVQFSHDEYVDFYSRDEKRLLTLERIAERLKMKRIE